MHVTGFISVKGTATLLHRGRQTILDWIKQSDITIRKVGFYGLYISHADLARLKARSDSEPDLSPKVGTRLFGHVSLSAAELRLHRRSATLASWCVRIGIPIRMIGAYGRYITDAHFARLEEYAADQPSWKFSRKLKTPANLLPIPEIDRRIAAASRYKRRTGGAEIWEEVILAELAQAQ